MCVCTSVYRFFSAKCGSSWVGNKKNLVIIIIKAAMELSVTIIYVESFMHGLIYPTINAWKMFAALPLNNMKIIILKFNTTNRT